MAVRNTRGTTRRKLPKAAKAALCNTGNSLFFVGFIGNSYPNLQSIHNACYIRKVPQFRIPILTNNVAWEKTKRLLSEFETPSERLVLIYTKTS
jgi:hypothetical protein